MSTDPAPRVPSPPLLSGFDSAPNFVTELLGTQETDPLKSTRPKLNEDLCVSSLSIYI